MLEVEQELSPGIPMIPLGKKYGQAVLAVAYGITMILLAIAQYGIKWMIFGKLYPLIKSSLIP